MPDFSSAFWNKPAAAEEETAFSVDYSCRFDGSSTYLDGVTNDTTNTTWTMAWWAKRCKLGAHQYMVSWGISSGGLFFYNDDRIQFYNGSGGSFFTARKFRDTSAWYHFTLTSTSNTLRLYVNGEQVTDGDFSSNRTTQKTRRIDIGRRKVSTYYYFDGYMADFHYVAGSAVSPDGNFIEKNDDGLWVPKEYTESHGDEGFHLLFDDTQAATAFADSSSSSHAITRTGDTTHTEAQEAIGSSSIYFDGSGDRLGVASSSDFNLTGDFTIEAWIRRNTTGTYDDIIASEKYYVSGFNNNWVFGVDYGIGGSTNYLRFRVYNGTNETVAVIASAYPLATNTWYHVALTRNGSGTDNCTMWVDGVAADTFTYTGDLGDNSNPCGLTIGDSYVSSTLDFAGHIDEIRISDIDRTASGEDLDATSGSFTLPTTAYSSDSNTKLLVHSNFKGGLGADSSGENNDFTTSNLGSEDQVIDTPAAGKNFCTLNPLDGRDAPLSEGNLSIGVGTSQSTRAGTMAMESGKWIYSMRLDSLGGGTPIFGFAKASKSLSGENYWAGKDTDSWGYLQTSTYDDVYHGGAAVVDNLFNPNFPAAGDVMVIALDIGEGKAWIGLQNGTSVDWYDSGNPASGTNATLTFTAGTAMKPVCSSYGTGSAATFNFGADATFAGQESPSTLYSDDNGNGVGEFGFSVPSGFKALCTANLPAVTLNNAKSSEQAFEAVTYIGNGNSSDDQDVAVSFAPDLVWVKNRDASKIHVLVDTVRGEDSDSPAAHKVLHSDKDDGEVSGYGQVIEPSSTGFTAWNNSSGMSASSHNQHGDRLVAWAWKAHQSGTNEKYNAAAGFSIVTYTGDGETSEDTQDISHSLGEAPEFMLVKNLDDNPETDVQSLVNWAVYHKDIGAGGYLMLDKSNASTSDTTAWGDTAPTGDVFTAVSYTHLTLPTNREV